MDGPRAPHDAEIPGVINFLNSELRSREGWSIVAEYPAAFSAGNLGNIRIIKDDNNEVLSHAVMRPMILKSPAGLFKVAAIGSVVTSTSHRNQGFSRLIIESCLKAAQAHACDFAILWTDLFDFYRKMGFELGGCEIILTLEKELNVPSEGFKILDSAKVSPEAIHRIYGTHTVSSLRTLEETAKYLQIPNMRVYSAWDQHGALKAYAIEGKGADLNGYVHEWGGSVSALLVLFSHIRKVQGRRITVITPRHSQNLIRQLREKGAVMAEGFLGMIKLLNTESLFAKVKRHSRALGVADFVLEKRTDGFFYIGTENNIFKTDSESDIVRLVFGPQKPSEIRGFDKETSSQLDRVLPLDTWIWGWDSI